MGGSEMRVVRCHSDVEELASCVTSFLESSAYFRGARPRRRSSCRNLAASWRDENSTSKPLWLRATRLAAVAVEFADVFGRASSSARNVLSPPVPLFLETRTWIFAANSPPPDPILRPWLELSPAQSSHRLRSSWNVRRHLCCVFGNDDRCATTTSKQTRRECGSVHTNRASSTSSEPCRNARDRPSTADTALLPSRACRTRRNNNASSTSDSCPAASQRLAAGGFVANTRSHSGHRANESTFGYRSTCASSKVRQSPCVAWTHDAHSTDPSGRARVAVPHSGHATEAY
mmetsp:Transcript_12538/g.37812  ORF Transcript_12538/g.37812 Transcript_12538/m.37812 type:complete len:289 (+) Transcript_12538:1364-2230(+)